jgi:hypothetical protein
MPTSRREHGLLAAILTFVTKKKEEFMTKCIETIIKIASHEEKDEAIGT